MVGIERELTQSDKKYIDVDISKRAKPTPHEIFIKKLNIAEKKSTKAGLPFARIPALNDFQADIDRQVEDQTRKYGSIQDRILVPEIDLNEYSNLKNYKLIDETEVTDNQLSKTNPGLNVKLKKKTYKFKDYGKLYSVMEDSSSAIKRAQDVLNKSRQ